MSYTIADIEFELSPEGLTKAITEVKLIQKKLKPAMERLINELARQGAKVARANLVMFDKPAYDYGELQRSIKDVPYKRGVGYVKTDCPYAIYVEFGTGPRGAVAHHPLGAGYRGTGWRYYNERWGHWVFTYGMGSRPFMYNTMRSLEEEAEATGGRIVATYLAEG